MTARLRAAAFWLVPSVALAGLLWILRSAGQTPDGLSYALEVRDFTDPFHPHHLAYVPAAWLLGQAAGLAPLTACVALNLASLPVLAWAAAGLAGALDLRRWRLAGAVMLLLGLRGVLFYATHAETYLPALAFSALTLRFAVAAADARMVQLPLQFAVLFHQTNVLLAAPLAALGGRSRGQQRALLAAIGGAGLLVLATYLLAYRAVPQDEGFAAWLLSYARADVPAWGSAGHFSPSGLAQMAVSQGRNLVPVPEAVAGPGAALTGLGLLALCAWHLNRLRTGARHADLRRMALAMLAVYWLFFLWWIPGDPDFFLVTALPLWLLLLILLKDLAGERAAGTVAAVLAGLLLAGNLAFSVIPMHSDPGPTRPVALALDAAAPAGAIIIADYATQQELLFATDRKDVREALSACAGAGAVSYPLVIGRAAFGELAGPGVPEGRACLERWFGMGSDRAGHRAYRSLPGGLGVLLSGEWDPAEPPSDWISDVQRELVEAPPKE